MNNTRDLLVVRNGALHFSMEYGRSSSTGSNVNHVIVILINIRSSFGLM